jgi:hypothetical protein
MFYGCDSYGDYRPGGKVSDYSLAEPIKSRSLNFYVQDLPMILAEATMHNALVFKLPVGLPYGVRVRVWSQWFPDTAFLGEMVSYSIYDESGAAVEVMAAYADFDVNTVPWLDIIA